VNNEFVVLAFFKERIVRMFYKIISCAIICSVIIGAMGCAGGETAGPVNETPIVETPAIEEPVVENPVVETPVVETPAAETPVVETPVKTPQGQGADEVIVTIGDKKLTMQNVLWKDPTGDAVEMALLARSWAEIQLLYDEAEKRGITSSPGSQFIAELNRKYAYAAELKKQIIDKVVVTDETALAYYEENKQRYALDWGGAMGLAHITVASEEEAEKAIQRIKDGEQFTKVCREVSIADDAKRGGVIIRNPYSQVQRKLGRYLLKALAEAKIGEVVGPVEGKEEDTYEIARKTLDKPKTFEEMKKAIKRRLLKSEQAKAMLEFMTTLEQAVPGGIQKSQRLIDAEKALQEAKDKLQRGNASDNTTETPSSN
jgi:hypothetical protein